jgi:hypothetical protein
MKVILFALALLTLGSCRVLTWTYHVPGGYYVTTLEVHNPVVFDNPFD